MVRPKFVESLCREQMENGRYVLHEHPGWATSSEPSPIEDLMRDDRAKRVRADQCMYCANVSF